jgi:3-hydroxyisobutyrate dehydrogenase-like beta-hydroxyacid dehydrogenase
MSPRPAGLDLAAIYDVISKSARNSWMFENRIPHVLKGDYTPRPPRLYAQVAGLMLPGMSDEAAQ